MQVTFPYSDQSLMISSVSCMLLKVVQTCDHQIYRTFHLMLTLEYIKTSVKLVVLQTPFDIRPILFTFPFSFVRFALHLMLRVASRASFGNATFCVGALAVGLHIVQRMAFVDE